MVECKNYFCDVANPEADQIAGRFSPNRGQYVIDAEQHFQIDRLIAPFVLETFKCYDGGATIFSIMK